MALKWFQVLTKYERPNIDTLIAQEISRVLVTDSGTVD